MFLEIVFVGKTAALAVPERKHNRGIRLPCVASTFAGPELDDLTRRHRRYMQIRLVSPGASERVHLDRLLIGRDRRRKGIGVQQLHRTVLVVLNLNPGLYRVAVVPGTDAPRHHQRLILVLEHDRVEFAVNERHGGPRRLLQSQRHRAVGMDDLESRMLHYPVLVRRHQLSEEEISRHRDL